MTEDDFTKVMAPKVTGARVLHNAFHGSDLEFFVMFGSAGSVIASPGQGNYAAANAVLDSFAHYRQAQGLPALTIGWGPWSVGMVEELKLEKIYPQRGIELITPAAGTRDPRSTHHPETPQRDRDQRRLGAGSPRRGRRSGFPMFSELGSAETQSSTMDSESSVLDFLSDARQPKGSNGRRRFHRSRPRFSRSLPPISDPTTVSTTSAWTL